MQDPYLAAVIRHVGAGGDPVEVALALTSGVLVIGFVRRAEFFVSVSMAGFNLYIGRSCATPGRRVSSTPCASR